MHLVVAYLKYWPSKFDDSAIMHNFNALPPGNLSTNINFDFIDDPTLGIFIKLRNLTVLGSSGTFLVHYIETYQLQK